MAWLPPVLAAAAAVLAVAALAVRVDASVVAVLSGDPGPSGAGARTTASMVAAAAIGRVVGSWAPVGRLFRPERTRRRLAAAGLDRTLDLERVMGFRVAAGLGGIALGLLVGLGPVGSLAAGSMGAVLPGLFVARVARKRTAAADRAVPELLDLLAAGSAAGLGAPLALRRAVPVVQGPLNEELTACLLAVDHGARWRDELAGVADRLDLPDLRRAVAAIVRTETLGASLADALRELAADVRSARRSRAAERARTAPVKMLFPLVFLILPAFLLLTVVPVLLATLRSIA